MMMFRMKHGLTAVNNINYQYTKIKKMKGVQKWTNKKIKYRKYIKEYYDADTGEEITEEKKISHLKGYVEFKNQKVLEVLKKINSKIHWEKCKDIYRDWEI